MEYLIGKYDPATRSVPVTFEHNGVKHSRSVNACTTQDGAYDKKATAARVVEVATGVQSKIEIGVITNSPAGEAPEPTAE